MRAALGCGFLISLVVQAFSTAGVVGRWRASAASLPAAASIPRVIRVDVIASDTRGRTIENLKSSDFELTENAVPQLLDSLQFVKTDGRPPAQPELRPIRSEFDEQEEAARNGIRLFAIL